MGRSDVNNKMTEPIRLRKEDGIGELLFNRPEAFNAFDLNMIELLEKTLISLAMDERGKIVNKQKSINPTKREPSGSLFVFPVSTPVLRFCSSEDNGTRIAECLTLRNTSNIRCARETFPFT